MTTGRKLTVIQVLPALNAGGVERGTLEVAAELVKRGHRSIVVSAGGTMLEKLLTQGSEHYTLPIGIKSPTTLRHIYGLRRILRYSGADILHPRSRLPAWICYLAWRSMNHSRRPHFITSVHGHYSVNRYSKIMVAGERVIAISESIKEYIIHNYPDTPPEKLVVIPRGVSHDQFPYGFRPDIAWLDRWQTEYPALRNKKLVLLPGRITRWKGQEDFLEIISKTKSLLPELHGVIVGGPHSGKESYYQELKDRIKSSNLQQHVTFTGHRNDLREIMSISAIVMSLSRDPEAFGRVVLESLCLGIPVIAYDHGGAGEVMKKIYPQGLIPEGDINAAIGLMLRFMNKMPTVPDNNPYTLERMLNSTLQLYQSVSCEGQRQPGTNR